MSNICPEIDMETLGAYLDGELDEKSRLRVQKQLEQNPEARQRLEAYRRQDQMLRMAMGDSPSEPIPERFQRLLDTPPSNTEEPAAGKGWPFWQGRVAVAAATGFLALAIGVFSGWNARGTLQERAFEDLAMEMFLNQAANSYSLYAGGDTSWAGTGFSGNETEFSNWFRSNMDINVSTPRFDDAGYEFYGARALPSSSGSAGQMLYRNQEGETVAVFFQVHSASARESDLRAARRNTAMARNYVERGDLSVYYWQSESGQTSYALLGAVESETLSMLADSILDQFSS